MDNGQLPNVMLTRGGLNCRHQWVIATDQWESDVKEPADRTPLSKIRLLADDPAGMMPQVAEIKKKYTAIFGN